MWRCCCAYNLFMERREVDGGRLWGLEEEKESGEEGREKGREGEEGGAIERLQ